MSSKVRHAVLSGRNLRKTGQRLLSGILSVATAGSILLSAMPITRAAKLDVGEVIKEVISSDSVDVADGVSYEQATFKTEDGRTVAGFILDTDYGAEGSNLKIGVGMPYGETEFAM